VVSAEEQLAEQIAAAYKHPAEDIALSQAFIGESDAGAALHQAAMYQRMMTSAGDEVAIAQRTNEFATGDAQQQQIVAAGAQASVDEWNKQADALRDALRDAKAWVATAQAGLTAAELEAARLAEEERRAEAARQAAAQFVSQTGAPPATLPEVGTMVCPVGQPNGFIDSWGFPRSGGRTHEGVDMFAPYGTPLFAVADGSIYRVYNNTLGGLSINLIDTKGNMYFYTHLSEASAVTGQQVRAGDTIGAVGQSGNAAGTPPHLHWQFHPGNGEPVNPYPLAYALCR
jgi:murein DD-endopeptidase MepM/ murein hydrolase activator NlpD